LAVIGAGSLQVIVGVVGKQAVAQRHAKLIQPRQSPLRSESVSVDEYAAATLVIHSGIAGDGQMRQDRSAAGNIDGSAQVGAVVAERAVGDPQTGRALRAHDRAADAAGFIYGRPIAAEGAAADRQNAMIVDRPAICLACPVVWKHAADDRRAARAVYQHSAAVRFVRHAVADHAAVEIELAASDPNRAATAAAAFGNRQIVHRKCTAVL